MLFIYAQSTNPALKEASWFCGLMFQSKIRENGSFYSLLASWLDTVSASIQVLCCKMKMMQGFQPEPAGLVQRRCPVSKSKMFGSFTFVAVSLHMNLKTKHMFILSAGYSLYFLLLSFTVLGYSASLCCLRFILWLLLHYILVSVGFILGSLV